MASNLCVSCKNSACCKTLLVEVNFEEYETLSPNMKVNFQPYINEELKKRPFIEGTPIHEMLKLQYSERYAKVKTNQQGHCIFLNPETMLCDVYDKRPSACKDYTVDRCETIRIIEQ